ncbi:acetolactate decarboxylase [Synechococcus sp. CBW1107]|uniref:acetolactate decarboxylase n=1 Tax=Synechococcus sp. CBW1107 TaxID=2789857 RepID=UPI002AD38510|nr:acetolactate decarboxylase [Synechococcus sp. CBW1107]CAK6692751.1 Alpha-acetolactate decarboxylase [Synechococcus sp. CBW1107]
MTCCPDGSHQLPVQLGSGLWTALQERCRRTGETPDHVIRSALAEALDLDHHTIYQVSTSGALVQGVYGGCVKVADLLQHGDFGLGTFAGLDGEGILLDGRCWQACSDGSVRPAPAEAQAPFWVVTRFAADHSETLTDLNSWADLTARLDALRDNANLFVAIRLRGVFERIRYRVACKAEAGVDLVQATSGQAMFELENVAGTLVGFWTPSYARTINVPGYHLHLLSDDHRHAGHVLELQSRELQLELHRENDLQLVLPETPEFLKADLSGDPAAALAKAEGDHP